MHRLSAATVVGVSLAAALAAAALAATGGAGSLALDGLIGTLRLDSSDRDAVIAAVGEADAEFDGQDAAQNDYQALGYDCSDTYSNTGPYRWSVGTGAYCRTVYFVNGNTGTVGTFFTSSTRFTGPHGVKVGTSTLNVRRRLGKRVLSGCSTGVYLTRAHTNMTVSVRGGHIHPHRRQDGTTELRVIGGHVDALVLHSRTNDVSVFDCL